MENEINKYDVFMYYNNYYKDFCTAIVIDDKWWISKNLYMCVIIIGKIVYLASVNGKNLKMHDFIGYNKMEYIKNLLNDETEKWFGAYQCEMEKFVEIYNNNFTDYYAKFVNN